ncbi:MAG: GNAT family N-acetyltransferase [Paracoccus sp. (in: a-proteobacteria)]|uniref:GNAT family N-acetyltransferase n=1 Tax=Paracoccus sp. TaxID=267 RepID=UPI00391938CC
MRLTRPWPEDAPAIAAAMTDWDTARWLTAVPWPYAETDARDFVAAASLDEYAIRCGDDLLGLVRAGSNFGLWIAPGAQGRGIGRRAGIMALSRLFLSGADRVSAHVLDGNSRSARLLDWLGFRATGTEQLYSEPMQRHVPATALRLDRDRFEALHPFALITPRLQIGPVTEADLPDLHAIATRPEVARMMLRFRPDMGLDEVAVVLRESALWPPLRLSVRHEGRVVGAVGLSGGQPPRLHYFLDPDLSGLGLGQEMVAAVFDELVARFAFPEILADVFLDNLASRKILKNLGFRRMEDVELRAEGRDAPADAALYRWRPGLLS